MFESVTTAPPDPIIGLLESFLADPRSEKVNLSIGEYRGPDGGAPVLACVKAAEKELLDGETTKGYFGIVGRPDFGEALPRLILGSDHPALAARGWATLQTPGGTGALRVAGDFLQNISKGIRVWLSQPTWPNHPSVFQAAGLEVRSYPYYDADLRSLDFGAMRGALEEIPAGDVVVLHGCCHNPTGVDLSLDQWQEIADLANHRGFLPLVDFAYQGFGSGLDEDAAGLRELARRVDELLICSSNSKNFGLYRERVGALTLLTGTPQAAKAATSRVKQCIRANYSNPPSHGAAIVAKVLGDEQLMAQWMAELTLIRDRINGVRQKFVQKMRALKAPLDFKFIQQQRGMFSYSGLSADQVQRLRDEYSIYVVKSGRINVAGLTDDNLDYVCQAILSTLG